MLKPNSLRSALINAVPALHDTPSMLRLWVDKGSNIATLASSLSFEKQFSLNVAITGFRGDIDTLFVPVMAWLRENQPDILCVEAGQKGGFGWTLLTNGDGTQDMSTPNSLVARRRLSAQLS